MRFLACKDACGSFHIWSSVSALDASLYNKVKIEVQRARVRLEEVSEGSGSSSQPGDNLYSDHIDTCQALVQAMYW